jgi:hypothetical protein
MHNIKELIQLTVKSVKLFSYPVGSIYVSAKATSPAELFGGTWKAIEDVFLYCAGPKHAAGETGGAETHTQTVEEMPAHNHSSPDAAPGFFAGWGNKSGDGWVTAASQGTGGNWSTTNTGGARPSRLCPHGGLCMHGSALPRVGVR